MRRIGRYEARAENASLPPGEADGILGGMSARCREIVGHIENAGWLAPRPLLAREIREIVDRAESLSLPADAKFVPGEAFGELQRAVSNAGGTFQGMGLIKNS